MLPRPAPIPIEAVFHVSAGRDDLLAIFNHPGATKRERLIVLIQILEGVAARRWPMPDMFEPYRRKPMETL
jgi:hypothetical protein